MMWCRTGADRDVREFRPKTKYSVSFIAKRIKGGSSRELREAFPHLEEWCGKGLWAPSCFHVSLVMGGGLWRDTFRTRRLRMRNRCIQALYSGAGFGDLNDEIYYMEKSIKDVIKKWR